MENVTDSKHDLNLLNLYSDQFLEKINEVNKEIFEKNPDMDPSSRLILLLCSLEQAIFSLFYHCAPTQVPLMIETLNKNLLMIHKELFKESH